MENKTKHETEHESLGGKLRDLLLDSYPDETVPSHPRQEAYRKSREEASSWGRSNNLPSRGSFPLGGLQGLEDQAKWFDEALRLHKEHQKAQVTEYAPHTSTIWSSPVPDLLPRATQQRQHSTMQERFREPRMAAEEMERLIWHNRIEDLCHGSRVVPWYGYPSDARASNSPQQTAWRNQVVQVWKDATNSEIRQCRNSDSFHSFGTQPCKWGWGKILYEYSWAYSQHDMENDDLNAILEWFRRQHAGEERLQAPTLMREPGIVDPAGNRYYVRVQAPETS